MIKIGDREMRKIYCLFENAVLGILFFGGVTPISVMYRLIGRDLLNVNPHGSQESYWTDVSQVHHEPHDFYAQVVKRKAR